MQKIKQCVLVFAIPPSIVDMETVKGWENPRITSMIRKIPYKWGRRMEFVSVDKHKDSKKKSARWNEMTNASSNFKAIKLSEHTKKIN